MQMLSWVLGALWAICLATVAVAEPAIKVVASFSILGDMTAVVAGEDARVTTLVGPNSDAHAYQPKPSDAKQLADAHLVVVNGLGFEGWIERLVRASGYKGPVVTASSGVTAVPVEHAAGHGHQHGKGHRALDPHAWQSLENGQIYVRNIAAGLAKVDPANAARYAARAEAYLRDLATLDATIKSELAAVPAAQRRVITSHDAFQYFARAYGVTFLAAAGVSTESEPSAAAVGALIRQIRKTGVKALFVENMTDQRLLAQIAREAGGVVGGTLYSDALARPGEPAGSYLGMVRHNLDMLKAGMLKN